MRSVESFDQGFWNFLQSKRGPGIDAVVLAATVPGHLLVLAVLVLGTGTFLALRRRFAHAGLLIAAYSGSVLLGLGMALLIDRTPPAPPEFRGRLEEAPILSSFPSQQTLTATATYPLLALVWSGGIALRKWRYPVLAIGFSMPLLVGLSRLFVGTCYPSDVLAGWIAGAAWAIACYAISQHWNRESLPHPDATG